MIPYRTRNALRKLCVTVLVLVLAAALALLCWLLWLNRYVIYTRDGAKLNFDLSLEFSQGDPVVAPTTGPAVDIYYNEGDNVVIPESTELTQLSGIYITGEMLADDIAAIRQQLKTLPADTPVMLDVKNIRGEFYYTTSLGKNAQAIDTDQMDGLIQDLKANHYLIARLPALRDYWYGLEHVNDGIFNPNQLSLWMDEERCYWLNPASDGTLTYLVQIAKELRTMGFDEVVFEDFCIPATEAIYFEGDRDAALNETAASLVTICAADTFAVSFANGSEAFQLPDGRSRLYLQDVAAADVEGIAQSIGLEDPEIRLVFLTNLKDTRYDAYGVLRPMDIVQ